ncbi:MAG: YggS family pyridoxal phosphate-dependent enzyme [Alphaproteobacteria bacterium]|nr:YggS family pyridoxal phosphate-dependent enzyme [Alphaproteobacteria bacterium]
MSQIQQNLEQVREKITKTAQSHRYLADDIHLIAVSKKQPQERIDAALKAGHRIFGENRVQEAVERWITRKKQYPDLELHLIGPLQTNKVKEAVALFDVIQTIDRSKLVDALAKEMSKQGKKPRCFIQVNTGEEEQKSGISPRDLPKLLAYCEKAGLEITGLMCIPPSDEPSALHFALLKKLAGEHNLPGLSMGMSNDFEKAIALGATYVRIGTALFGTRTG